MKSKIDCFLFLLLIQLILVQVSFCQNSAPFLNSDGKYSIVDLEGKVLTQERYDEFIYQKSKENINPIITTKRNNLYGVMAYPSYKELYPPSFTNKPYPSNFYLERVLENNEKAVDTFLSLRSGKTNIIYQPNTTFKPIIVNTNRYTSKLSYDYEVPRIIHNLFKYHTEDGLINFFNMKTKQNQFEDDFINGQILSKDRLSKENESGHLALVDLKGKTLTPHQYGSIAFIDEDHFIVKTSNDYKGKYGLINKNGKLVIDTLYTLMTKADNQKLIVKKDNQYGILEYNNDVYIPIEQNAISNASSNHLLIHTKDGYKILNTKTNKIIFDKIHYARYHSDKEAYEMGHDGSNTELYSVDFKLFYNGPLKWFKQTRNKKNYIIKVDQNNFVLIKDNQPAGNLQNTQDIIYLYSRSATNYYKVKQDTSFGVMNSNFELLLEPKYKDVAIHNNQKETTLLGLDYTTGIYSLFDTLGNKSMAPPIADPSFLNTTASYVTRNINGQKKLLFRDGTTMDQPDYKIGNKYLTPQNDVLYPSQTADGLNYYILNHKLLNIIPEGYFIPKKYYNSRYLKMGLIPVYDAFNSGVINGKGDWIINPSYNAYDIQTEEIIIKKGDVREDVELFTSVDGQWRSKVYKRAYYERGSNHIQVTQLDKQNPDETLMGILDSIGQPMIPIEYKEILNRKHIIAAYKPITDSTGTTMIFTKKGVKLFDTPYRVEYKNANVNFIYITDPKKAFKGVISNQNEVILEPQFKNLHYYPEHQIYTHSVKSKLDKTNIYYVMSLDGQTIFSGKNLSIHFMTTSQHYIIYQKDKTHIFNGSNEKVATLDYKFSNTNQYLKDYIKVTNDQGQVIYVHLKSGQLMAE